MPEPTAAPVLEVTSLRKEFGGLRTGRASVSLLEPVTVNAYGNMMPLNQLANINVPEPRLITVQVWDRGMVKAVDKAIREAGLGLLRRGLETLIEQLARLTTPEGKPLELALTTNGSLLAAKARSLRDAGLNRVTVSLDAVDDAIFRRMSDVDLPVARILDGIEAACAVSAARRAFQTARVRRKRSHGVMAPRAGAP